MEFLFDTANLEAIETYQKVFPITGVTSNPSIIKAEGKIDLFHHFKKIREIIGPDKSLHIQVVCDTCDEMLKEAEVPVTEEGLKAIQILKARGIKITATAIYTKMQAIIAVQAGADYIAPYFNRMENMSIDPRSVIAETADLIRLYGYQTKILAASFKNAGQVTDAFSCGAHSATVAPSILCDALKMPAISQAVDNFRKDWESVYGQGVGITDLAVK